MSAVPSRPLPDVAVVPGTVATEHQLPHQHVALAHAELAVGVAHGRRAVAAAAGLVEHHRAVPADELADELDGRRGGHDARRQARWRALRRGGARRDGHAAARGQATHVVGVHQKKPCGLPE